MSDNQRLRKELEAGIQTHPEGQTVLDSNGEKLGTVIDHNEPNQYLVVEKGAFFTKDLYIPYSSVTGTDDQGIRVNIAKGDFDEKEFQRPPDESATPTASAPSGAGSALSGQDDMAGSATMTAGAMDDAPPVQTARVQERQAAPPVQQTDTDDEIRVPVYEEELVAGKREEEIGQVHLRKEVETAQETVPVTLRREEVTVDRVPVNQDIDPNAATDAFKNADIDVPVMGEEAIVGKQVHEVEEVRLHKQGVTAQEQVSGTVRRERVVVDGEGAQGGAQAAVSTDDRTS